MRYILITALLFLTFEVKAQIPDSLIAHLDSALLLLKEKSLYHKKVDWDKVKGEMYSRAAQARTKNETFDAIAYGFAQLNDKHGFFMQNGRRYRLTDSIHLSRLSDSLKAEWGKGWKIHMKMLGKVAYFRMPNINAFNQKQVNSYANQLYDSIAHLAAQKPQSWILDLRRNAGGNIRPMMAALAPFFDEGIVSYELDRDDRVTGFSAFKNGDYVSNDTLVEATIIKKIRSFPNAKVAVIIGAGTSSSGEGVAAMLKERKNTRVFGEPTAGYANSTEGFLFNNQNTYFLLTTSQISGKTKKPFPEAVSPDVKVVNNDHFNELRSDRAVQAALKWLE